MNNSHLKIINDEIVDQDKLEASLCASIDLLVNELKVCLEARFPNCKSPLVNQCAHFVFEENIKETSAKQYIKHSYFGIIYVLKDAKTRLHKDIAKEIFDLVKEICFDIEKLNWFSSIIFDKINLELRAIKRSSANSLEIFKLAESNYLMIDGKFGFGDYVIRPTSIFLLRQAIEIRIKNALGVRSVSSNQKFVKISSEKFIDFCYENLNIEISPEKSIVKKIHTWTNYYIHGGIIPSHWKTGLALIVLRPMFTPHSSKNSFNIHGSIKISKSYYDEKLRSDLNSYVAELLKCDKSNVTIEYSKHPEVMLCDFSNVKKKKD